MVQEALADHQESKTNFFCAARAGGVIVKRLHSFNGDQGRTESVDTLRKTTATNLGVGRAQEQGVTGGNGRGNRHEKRKRVGQ